MRRAIPTHGRIVHGKALALGFAACSFLVPANTRANASEQDALAISANIQAVHFPYGTVLDPVFTSPTGHQVGGYTRCGDSAVWTGHYLAAEAFRFQVTRAPDALNNVNKAIAGIKALIDVTGTDVLARCLFPQSSPYAPGMESEEARNGIYFNKSMGYVWVGNTSRDQYVGVVFGLGVAYDMVDDPAAKNLIGSLVTRLIQPLLRTAWTVVLPDGSISTSFLARPDEMLSILQVGQHVNPSQFSSAYLTMRTQLAPTVLVPIGVDVLNDSSYFKFNLAYITLYNLIRLETDSGARSLYMAAYDILRRHTSPHQNAFFNVIDRTLRGATTSRDNDTLMFLDQWLMRSTRDFYVDLTKVVPVCGSEACQPIPIPLRTPTDFLWQRDPFQLTGGLLGDIESAGIDYILPYWMGRYYGLSTTAAFAVRSAAAGGPLAAPNSIASIYGSNLATSTAQAASQPLPVSLGGVLMTVTDSAGNTRDAPLLYVSPGQINFVMPDGTAPGPAIVMITSVSGVIAAPGMVQNVAPALFGMNGSGVGVAAATALRTQAADPRLQSSVPVFQCAASGCVSVPLALGVDTPMFLTLYGTGIRNQSPNSNVTVTINGVGVPVLYAGAQPNFAGLDQVNVALPLNLRGSGESNVTLTVDGHASNSVTINIQ